MIEMINTWWLLVVGFAGALIGWCVCALLAAGKIADERMHYVRTVEKLV